MRYLWETVEGKGFLPASLFCIPQSSSDRETISQRNVGNNFVADAMGGADRSNGNGGQLAATLYAAYGTKWNGNAGAYNGENFVLERKFADRSAGFIGQASPSAGSVGFDYELAATLKAEQITNCVIALQGNGIDRSDNAGCNGCGWREGEIYTLNTIDRPAVCYDARGNGDGEIVNTLTGDHKDRITDYTAIAVQERKIENNANAFEKHAREILPVLQEEVGKETAAERRLGIFNPLQPPNVLRSDMYGKGVSQQGEQCNELGRCSQGGTKIDAAGIMRNMWEEKRDGCSPQRRRLSKQQSGQLNENMQKLPQQDTYEKAELCDMWEAGEGVGILRQALSKIQKIRKPDDGKYQSTHRRYIIRRLTPTEAARLQGFPDAWSNLAPYNPADAAFWEDVCKTHARINGKAYKPTKNLKAWYDKLHTDSAEYKDYGNGLALPCAEFVMHNIAEQGIKTLGSLFDGIGGFPLAGEMNDITPVWASEIEPYPIAVTLSRFGGNAMKEKI